MPVGMADPTFFGGYAEVGYFLTSGDTRGYKDGKFDRTKPKNPVGKGGMGSLQFNLRYDRLDLSDAAILGRSEEHTSELQSLMRISYAVFCLKKKKTVRPIETTTTVIIQ